MILHDADGFLKKKGAGHLIGTWLRPSFVGMGAYPL
jgi:hypothetical protein